MLEEIRRNYIKQAKAIIPDYQSLDVNKLCNLYVENENNTYKKSGYFAAILLKKWGYIGRHYLESKSSGFSIEDCYDMIVDAICYVLKAKSWLNPDKAIYKDPQGPDKCLNMAIWSSRRLYYYLSNRDKRKGNFGNWSLDVLETNVTDHSSILDSDNTLESKELSIQEMTDLNLLIEHLFDTNRVIEGLIVDNICYDDCFSNVKKDGKLENEFKLYKLINNLREYNSETVKQVCLKYNVAEYKVIDVLPILTSDKNRLTKIVKSLMKKMSTDEVIKKSLCY